jgi:hypothetical protein
MKALVPLVPLVLLSAIGLFHLGPHLLFADEAPAKAKEESGLVPATVVEARGRAKLLHETIHGVLQLVHRDFFDPDEMDFIPSATLDELFADLAEKQKVKLHWLGVEGKTMSVNHKPQDDFERKAVAALKAGKIEFEEVGGERYRRVAPIVLHNSCLKCHVPNRQSLEDRVAGLAISMSFVKPAAK